MITVRYTRYRHDYDRKEETRSMYSLQELADWMFDKADGNYTRNLFFVDPDADHPFWNGKLRLDSSCISTNGYTDNGYCIWVQQIEQGGKIIYSTGKYTNGICHWNDEIKQWLRDCNARRKNPQFNFG